MKKFIEILLSTLTEKKGGIRVIFLCTIAATTFWFFNALNKDYSTTLRYPIQLLYDTDNYVPTQQLPEDVLLNVNGLGWSLFRNSLGIKVDPLQINLETPSEMRRIPGALIPGLITDQLKELQLNYVLTDTLFINLEERTSTVLKVKVDSSSINLDANHRVTSVITCLPTEIQVNGPKSLVEQLPDLFLVKIPEEEIDDDYDEDIPLNLPSNLLKRDPPTVEVQFAVSEFVSQEIIVPIRKIGFPAEQGIELTKRDVKVSYMVEKGRTDEVATDSFDITAYFDTINVSDSTIEVGLHNKPDFVTDVKIDTTVIKVTLL